MIHFFPELAALYHRSVLVSLNTDRQVDFFDEWIKQLWRISPDQSTFHTIPPRKNPGFASGWMSGSLGKRNLDQQRLISTSLAFADLVAKPGLADLGDSLFIELDWNHTDTERIFRWTPPTGLGTKKIVWCLKQELSTTPSLHELALDKKLKEISPNSLRIIWGDGAFMRDALEWVLSF